MPITAAERDRAALADLVRRLAIDGRHVRRDDRGPLFIVGDHGSVRPISGRLVVSIRSPRAARDLIVAGVLDVVDGAIVLARMPHDAEIVPLRELVGLDRERGAA